MAKYLYFLFLGTLLAVGCEKRQAEVPVATPPETPAVVAVPPAPTVEDLADTTLPDLSAEPRYFRLARITLPPGNLAQYAVGDSMVYQLSGTTEIAAGEVTRKLGAGEGMYVPAGALASYLAAAGDEAVYLQFMLTPREDLMRSLTAGADIRVEDVFVSAEALPELTSGDYRFGLTRLQYPPGTETAPAQERTAAGLYYVAAGSGVFAGGETPQNMQTGAAVLAPVKLTGAWTNPGSEPLEVVFASLVPAAGAPTGRGE